MNLRNNTILITGGTSGFGLEFTKRFVELDNTIIITGRNQEKLAEAKRLYPKIHTFRSDITKIEEIQDLYRHIVHLFPDLNILINNAGEMRGINLHHAHALHDITREIEINLMGPIRLVQQLLPLLKQQQKAAIVNVTSGIALVPMPLAPIYSGSKAGFRSYTQALRVQLKNTNIKVMELVSPGSNTPLNVKFRALTDFHPNPRMLLTAEKIVDAAIVGLQKDKEEVFPGNTKLFGWLSRIAPKFLLEQASKMGASYMYADGLRKLNL